MKKIAKPKVNSFFKKLIFVPFFLLFILQLSSCSIETIGPKVAGSLLQKGSLEAETENNWNLFRAGMPGNIKFIEGLLYIKPDEKNLLLSLIKGHTSYGLVVEETLDLDKHLALAFVPQTDSHTSKVSNTQSTSDTTSSEQSLASDTSAKEEAIFYYGRALNYGFRYLGLAGITYDELVSAQANIDIGPENKTENKSVNKSEQDKDQRSNSVSGGGVIQLLNKKLHTNSEEDLNAVFFMAQAWAGLINLQRDKPQLLAQLPTAKLLIDWVCTNRPNFFYGSCDIFYGVYESSRPPALGGQPEKGREHFIRAIKNNPQNLFARIAFIQYYLIQMAENGGILEVLDEKGSDSSNKGKSNKTTPVDEYSYKELKKFLDLAFKNYRSSLEWNPNALSPTTSSAAGTVSSSADLTSSPFDSHLNLLNSTAEKRWAIIKKYEKNIFGMDVTK